VSDWTLLGSGLRRRFYARYGDRHGHRHLHGANLGVLDVGFLAGACFACFAAHEDVGLPCRAACLARVGAVRPEFLRQHS